MRISRRTILLLIAVCAAVVSGCGSGAGYSQQGYPQHFRGPTAMVVTPNFYDLRGSYVYIVNSQGDTMSVLDAKFRTIVMHDSEDEDRVDIVRLGMAPYDIAITPEASFVYITDALDGTLRRVQAHPPFDVHRTNITARSARIVLPTDQDPEGQVYAYMTAPDDMMVLKMLVGEDLITSRAVLPGKPVSLDITPDKQLILVTTDDGDLLFVDAYTMRVFDEATIHLGGRPTNVLAKDDSVAYVINNDPPQIHVIDIEKAEEKELEIEFDVPLGDFAMGTHGRYLYITGQNGEVYVMDTRINRPCNAGRGRIFFEDIWPPSNPTIDDVDVFDCKTRDEEWYIEYDGAADNWKVTGSESGRQATRALTNQYYISDNGLIGFRINQSDRYPSDGDTFYFETFGGIEPIGVGLIPDGVVALPYWKKPDYDLIFVANTGTHNISVIYSEEQVSVGAIN